MPPLTRFAPCRGHNVTFGTHNCLRPVVDETPGVAFLSAGRMPMHEHHLRSKVGVGSRGRLLLLSLCAEVGVCVDGLGEAWLVPAGGVCDSRCCCCCLRWGALCFLCTRVGDGAVGCMGVLFCNAASRHLV